jgi:hypothetical protein
MPLPKYAPAAALHATLPTLIDVNARKRADFVQEGKNADAKPQQRRCEGAAIHAS